MGHDRDLLPMGSTFDVSRRGYDRAQVDAHLDRLDADLRILAADRDAAVAHAAELAKQVENQRAQLVHLEQEIARLSIPPTSMEGLSERMQRMLRLAQDEAAEITARAESEAAGAMARAEADGAALRDRYQRLIAEVDARRSDMENEHRVVMDKARAEAGRIVADATAHAQQLEGEAVARHRQIEDDFDIAMAARRADAMRSLAEQEATSKAEAERRVREATEEAARRVSEATNESRRRVTEAQTTVDRLAAVREDVSSQLLRLRSILAEATDALETPASRPAIEAEIVPTADALPVSEPAAALTTGESDEPQDAVVVDEEPRASEDHDRVAFARPDVPADDQTTRAIDLRSAENQRTSRIDVRDAATLRVDTRPGAAQDTAATETAETAPPTLHVESERTTRIDTRDVDTTRHLDPTGVEAAGMSAMYDAEQAARADAPEPAAEQTEAAETAETAESADEDTQTADQGKGSGRRGRTRGRSRVGANRR